MKYLRIINNQIEYPFSLQALKKEYSNTSFPEKLETVNLEEYNIYIVTDVPKPSDESYTKLVSEGLPVLTNNQYYQNWIVEDAPIEYTESMLQNTLDSKWSQVRSIRNQYLSESDWTVLPDSPLNETKKQEWIAYRQALRDITLQSDPFNITWPIKPE